MKGNRTVWICKYTVEHIDAKEKTAAEIEETPSVIEEETADLFAETIPETKYYELPSKPTLSSYTNIAHHTEFEKKVILESEKTISDCKKLDTELPASLIQDFDRNLNNSIEELNYTISHLLVIIRSVIDANTVSLI